MERTHIAIFGPRNAGKSSLMNMLTSQQVSIVSPMPGTTTDPVSKPIEVNGIGPCVFIDTAGYDDVGELGVMRVTKTKEILSRCDMAIFLLPDNITDKALVEAKKWYALISSHCPKTLLVINKFLSGNSNNGIPTALGADKTVYINALTSEGRSELLAEMGFVHARTKNDITIATHLVKPSDTVVLVMPQDIQAPAGRLILPQVQTIRELIDYGCTVVCSTLNSFTQTLASLASDPALIITDSQAFKTVFQLKPDNVPLTSFSVLLARAKGDIDEFIAGTKAFANLKPDSRVLIAEACSHAPLSEDIGREKIPAMIHKLISPDIRIDVVSGYDWKSNLNDYDLVIHCGACMFNRTQVLSRLSELKEKNIPVTNYGVAIAYFTGILDKIVY